MSARSVLVFNREGSDEQTCMVVLKRKVARGIVLTRAPTDSRALWYGRSPLLVMSASVLEKTPCTTDNLPKSCNTHQSCLGFDDEDLSVLMATCAMDFLLCSQLGLILSPPCLQANSAIETPKPRRSLCSLSQWLRKPDDQSSAGTR